MNSLTLKQRAFAKEYSLEGNRRQAAIRAGYRVKSASERGGKLLQDPRIQSLIEKERAAQIELDDSTPGGHIRALAVVRDEARAAGRFQAAVQAERARGRALGFQPGGAKLGEPAALDSPDDVAWTQAIAGDHWREAIGAPNQAARPGASDGADGDG